MADRFELTVRRAPHQIDHATWVFSDIALWADHPERRMRLTRGEQYTILNRAGRESVRHIRHCLNPDGLAAHL